MKSKGIRFGEEHQSGDRSTFVEEAKERQANAVWLKWSRNISLSIIDYMDKHNMNQTDLAKFLGVSRQYVSKLLSGKEKFSIKTIAELEEKLGIEAMAMA